MKKIKRPTPETDAFREVVFAQYKEDELTGDGMGSILAALTDIETLERERDEAREERDKLQIMRNEVVAANKGAKINAQVSNSLAGKLNQAERERDEAITRRMETIMQCELYEQERDEAQENFKSIVDKANELIARWDQPSWKDTAPTARYINALRIAVRAYERQKP